MKQELTIRFAALSSALGVGVALMVCSPVALAQEAKPATPQAAPVGPAVQAPPPQNAASAQAPKAMPQPAQDTAEMAEAEEPAYERLQVGDATQSLLAWQRGGELASPTPRPIAGNVANRSYERYLKSFEFPIPEHMTSSVKSSSGSGSAPK